ncbi:helix-turn-helix transcriptional regulator [Streptomyces hygroscopicus]|uniref:helix-turn-helix transcriptional regulator n=1 Tax=Streptomyces hygroscopicus TaxID=1912 RepID=UPI000781574F|nr:LuxR family transcriptional regulator [Streptomyces hygroscopicus]
MPTPTHQRNAALVGRRDELREIETTLGRAGSAGRLLIVHGDPGVGKTTLARAALRAVEHAGTEALVIRLHPAAHGDPGLDAVVDQVCDTLVEETSNNTLALVTAVRRRQAQKARDRQYHLPVMLETQRAVREAAGPRPVIVLLDNANVVAERDLGALGALLYGLRSDGACVVVSGWMPMGCPGPVSTLAAAADQVVEVAPLSAEETAELARQQLGWPPAPELVAVLRRDLGRLFGNPRAVLLALSALGERGQLAVTDGRMCPTRPEAVVPLPGFHAELQRVWQPMAEHQPAGVDGNFPGEVLAVLTRMTAAAETTVDDFLDLALDVGSRPEHLGRVLDILVALRLVTVDDRRRLACPVPSLGTEMFREERDIARLHAKVVLNARRRVGGNAGALAPRLADHALAAGSELAVGVSRELLLAAARCGGPDDTSRAMRACLALLRQLRLDDERLPGILRTAIASMLHHGDADGLLDLGDRLLPRLADLMPGVQGVLHELASAWALAAFHNQWLGTHVIDGDTPAARTAMRVPQAAALLTLAARVRADPDPPHAGPPVAPAPRLPEGPGGSPAGMPAAHLLARRIPSAPETRLLIRALGPRAEPGAARSGGARRRTVDGPVPANHAELHAALAIGDWATSWEMVLGDRCVRFLDSPLHGYQALVREYLGGSWDAALKAARAIVTDPAANSHGPLYVHSRSIASDICRWRGDPQRAATWLAGVSAGAEGGPLLCWARLGVRQARGEVAEAWRRGWQDFRSLRAEGHLIGAERLLFRVVECAVRAGDGRAALDALEALEELDAAVGSRLVRATTLLARAHARDEVACALDAYGPLVRYGGRELAFVASMWLLRATGAEEWLLEAWKWSEGMSSRPARRRLVDLAQEKGLHLPRRRRDRSAFTRLELKVIEMVVAGRTNRQISVALARSEKSVEAYLAKIFERTGCRTRVELAKAWLDGGLKRYVPD